MMDTIKGWIGRIIQWRNFLLINQPSVMDKNKVIRKMGSDKNQGRAGGFGGEGWKCWEGWREKEIGPLADGAREREREMGTLVVDSGEVKQVEPGPVDGEGSLKGWEAGLTEQVHSYLDKTILGAGAKEVPIMRKADVQDLVSMFLQSCHLHARNCIIQPLELAQPRRSSYKTQNVSVNLSWA